MTGLHRQRRRSGRLLEDLFLGSISKITEVEFVGLTEFGASFYRLLSSMIVHEIEI